MRPNPAQALAALLAVAGTAGAVTVPRLLVGEPDSTPRTAVSSPSVREAAEVRVPATIPVQVFAPSGSGPAALTRARSFRRPSDPRRFLLSDPRHSPPPGHRSGICRRPAILCPSRRRRDRSRLRSRRPRPLRHPHRLPRPCRLRLLHRFRFPLPNPSPPWRHGSLPRCPSAQLSLSRPASAGKATRNTLRSDPSRRRSGRRRLGHPLRRNPNRLRVDPRTLSRYRVSRHRIQSSSP